MGVQALRGEPAARQPSTWVLMHESPLGDYRRQAIDTLVELGADCSIKLPESLGKMSAATTLASASFMASLILCDPGLFVEVVSRGATMDEALLSTLTQVDLAHDMSMNGQAWEKRPIGDQRRACLNKLCEYIIERMMESICDDTGDIETIPVVLLFAVWVF